MPKNFQLMCAKICKAAWSYTDISRHKGFLVIIVSTSGQRTSVALADLIAHAFANVEPKFSCSKQHLSRPDWTTTIFCQKEYGAGRCYVCDNYRDRRLPYFTELLNDCTAYADSIIKKEKEHDSRDILRAVLLQAQVTHVAVAVDLR